MLDFPGRRFYEWALVLPMAMPAYVMAYAYTDFLQFVGPVQSGLRAFFGWRAGDYWFPDVRTVGGAVFFHSPQQVGGDPLLPQRIHQTRCFRHQ